MREGVDGLPQDNAPEAIDVVTEQPAQQALVTEQVDQGNRRQHRRCQQWQQRDTPPQPLGRDQRALQGISEQVCQGDHDRGNREGNRQAVAKQPVEVVAGKQFTGRQQTATLAGIAAEAAPEDRQQRHQHRQQQQGQQQALATDDEQPITECNIIARCVLGLGQRQRHGRGHLRQTPAGSAAAGPPRCPASPSVAWLLAPVRRAADGPAGP
ncbi:hypothetical protein D3C79_753180 [compost metagenome]